VCESESESVEVNRSVVVSFRSCVSQGCIVVVSLLLLLLLLVRVIHSFHRSSSSSWLDVSFHKYGTKKVSLKRQHRLVTLVTNQEETLFCKVFLTTC